jgi:cytochrome c-type biogenesis protein CcmH
MLRILLLILFLLPFSAVALTSEERLSDPDKEKQAHEIFKQIRCVVCSGESINDSKADIAKSLRVLIRQRVSQGMAEKQIIDEIINSYGESILMKPPFNKNTLILWIAPLFILIAGIVIIFIFFRQKLEK